MSNFILGEKTSLQGYKGIKGSWYIHFLSDYIYYSRHNGYIIPYSINKIHRREKYPVLTIVYISGTEQIFVVFSNLDKKELNSDFIRKFNVDDSKDISFKEKFISLNNIIRLAIVKFNIRKIFLISDLPEEKSRQLLETIDIENIPKKVIPYSRFRKFLIKPKKKNKYSFQLILNTVIGIAITIAVTTFMNLEVEDTKNMYEEKISSMKKSLYKTIKENRKIHRNIEKLKNTKILKEW